jgi:predicted O-methyltransferase YrrM
VLTLLRVASLAEAQLGDFNGYGLTFTAQEVSPANFLECTTEAGLATLFATAAPVDASIVTS